MLRLASSVITAARLYLMRRSQYDNPELRRYFRERHDIEVGLYSYGCFDRWRMPGPMRVGRYCSVAGSVHSAPRNHPMTGLTTHPVIYSTALGVTDEGLPAAEPLVLEDDVWIGHNVVILPRCRLIGRGSVIGAGSILTENVDRYSVMAGNPARKLRDRFAPDLAAAIEASRWWELDIAKLQALAKDHRDLLRHPTVERLEAWKRERGR